MAKKQIFLLEDDLGVLSAFAQKLTGNYDVITATDIYSAEAALADTDNMVACFVLDLNLPTRGIKKEYEKDCLGKNLTGWVFYRKYILMDERYNTTPVVLRSAYIDDPLKGYVEDKPDQKQLLDALYTNKCIFTKSDDDERVIARINDMFRGRKK